MQRNHVRPGLEFAQIDRPLLHHLSALGEGFDTSNLYKMTQFYWLFQNLDAASLNLSWAHFGLLVGKWIEQGYAAPFDIANIASDQRQPVFQSGCR